MSRKIYAECVHVIPIVPFQSLHHHGARIIGATRILQKWPLHWLAWSPMVLAFYIAWSRVCDHWQHLEDVIAGAVLGTVFALKADLILVNYLPIDSCR